MTLSYGRAANLSSALPRYPRDSLLSCLNDLLWRVACRDPLWTSFYQSPRPPPPQKLWRWWWMRANPSSSSLSLSTLWPDGPHKLMANSRDFNSPFIIYSPERRKSPPCEVGGRPGVGGGGQRRDRGALIGSHLMVLALWVSSA